GGAGGGAVGWRPARGGGGRGPGLVLGPRPALGQGPGLGRGVSDRGAEDVGVAEGRRAVVLPRTRRRVRGTPGRLVGHPVAWAACRMTRGTTCALGMRDRCPDLTTVMWAPARWAMNV